eukprot:TRINITY_DN11733_c0_g1_i1.p1 TRINITY_DN11733_c0_g1~~TRINITY_DN11733_c0_g1_i1.p1  ORF type:complete len:438 (+),score=136.53 TRINITY_DN11733_c0_g1_i1:61-1314(+)
MCIRDRYSGVKKNMRRSVMGGPPEVTGPQKKSVFFTSSGANHHTGAGSLASRSRRGTVLALPKKTTFEKYSQIAVYNSVLLHESLFANKIIETMREDIVLLLGLLNSQNEDLRRETLVEMLNSISQDRIPRKWLKFGLKSRSRSLLDFIKSLVAKLENINILVYNRNCRFFPIILMSKFFDPFNMLTSTLWHYAVTNQVCLSDLDIILIRSSMKGMPQEPIMMDGYFLSGLTIKNASMDNESTFLEEENSREFSSPLPTFVMRINVRESKTQRYLDSEPCVNMFIVNKKAFLLSSSPIDEFLEDQSEYLDEDFNNVNYEVAKPAEKGAPPSVVHDEKIKVAPSTRVYTVRLPFKNPLFSYSPNALPLKFHFYFKSLKPQEFWDKRRARIGIGSDFQTSPAYLSIYIYIYMCMQYSLT